MHQSVDMKPFVKDTGQNSLTVLLGIGLTLAANVLHLAASYLIKIKHLSPTDHLLSRAFTQTLTFGLWSFLSAIFSRHLGYQGKKQSHHYTVTTDKSRSLLKLSQCWERHKLWYFSAAVEDDYASFKCWLSAVLCNIAMAVTLLLQFVSVKMLPLSDFVTFQFTAPVFAMIASVCLKR